MDEALLCISNVLYLIIVYSIITEAMTYACFNHLMKRMTRNFPHGGAMDTHFANMRSLIQVCTRFFLFSAQVIQVMMFYYIVIVL